MPTKVLLSPIDTSNPFVLQLERSLPATVEVARFSWKRALLGRYHVLHLHWPERIVRGRGRFGTLVQQLLAVVLLIRLTIFNTAVVRTNHNTEPHDPATGLEVRLLRWIDRRTDIWVHLAAADIEQDAGPSHVVIPHGDYRDWYDFAPFSRPDGRTLLFFGRIRPYKGVENLLQAVRSMGAPRPFHLRLAGRPTTADLQVELDHFVATADDVSAVLRFVEDEELVAEIAGARAVCLPYQAMGNSGALLLALSAGRPVIAPRTPTNLELQDEVGQAWMHLYEEPLTSEKLSSAWEAVCRVTDSAPPSLGARSWEVLGPQYGSAYDLAIEIRRGQRRTVLAPRRRSRRNA